MGANSYFNDIKTTKTVNEAFTEVVESAQWEHGHGGYSGTIAEKSMDGFVLVEMPAGATAHDFMSALEELCYAQTNDGEHFDPTKVDEGLQQQLLQTMGEAKLVQLCHWFYDKWGPAIAVKTDDGWAFFGYASS